jgi:mannan endo-1,4-beta-mannosidase
MSRKLLVIAALVVLSGAAIFFVARSNQSGDSKTHRTSAAPAGFITTYGTRFSIDGKPFRFVGANVAVMYLEKERDNYAETLREAANDGAKVIRIWANAETGKESTARSTGGEERWPGKQPYRFGPEQWNEEAFTHLDKIIAEAAKNKLYVQICFVNWWRDTGGVTQYLKWAGIDAAVNDAPYGINVETALQFYTNEQVKKWYKAHVEKIVMRRNTVTNVLYKDDKTIMAWELINEAQAPTAKWNERKAWVEEMSNFVRSLDANHLITSGTWGYRNAVERRAWIEEHRLPNIDFADIHNYPADDLDSFVDSPQALKEFLANRVAAAYAINKPLVIGEFGFSENDYKGFSKVEWFRSYFEDSARLGVAGAFYWVFTPDIENRYGITYKIPRDEPLRAEIKRGAEFMTLHQGEGVPEWLKNSEQHLIPRQFSFARPDNDPIIKPQIVGKESRKFLYRFRPEAVASGRFERIGGGDGFIWGSGMGYFEYVIPEREKITSVGQIVVRAALKPLEPFDSRGRIKTSNVTLFVNGVSYGSRLVELPAPDKANVYEWVIDSWSLRWSVSRGNKMIIRFAVEPTAENPYGLTIANFPYDSKGVAPVEVELK